MKLIDNLYKIKNSESCDCCCHAEFFQDSVIYKAHFPDHPITPGVCILALVRDCASALLGREMVTETVNNVKFKNMIVPTETREVEVVFSKLECEGNEVKVKAKVMDEKFVFAEVSMICVSTK